MKDNTIAHLSDQLAALSARLQEVERRQQQQKNEQYKVLLFKFFYNCIYEIYVMAENIILVIRRKMLITSLL